MLEDMSKLEGMSKRKREDESIWRIFEKSRKKQKDRQKEKEITKILRKIRDEIK